MDCFGTLTEASVSFGRLWDNMISKPHTGVVHGRNKVTELRLIDTQKVDTRGGGGGEGTVNSPFSCYTIPVDSSTPSQQ